MSAGDKNIYLQPGQKNYPVRAGGDFIFLKDAPRPVRVMIDGQPIIMRPGSKQRIARKEPDRQAFDDFQVDNLSEELPLQITFVVGQGDYDEQIVTGIIDTKAIIERANGDTAADSRRTFDFVLAPGVLQSKSYTQGDTIKTGADIDSFGSDFDRVEDIDWVFDGPDGLIGVAGLTDGINGTGWLLYYNTDCELVSSVHRGLENDAGTKNLVYIPKHGLCALGADHHLWNLDTGADLGAFENPNGYQLYTIAYIPSRNQLAISAEEGGSTDYVMLFDADTLALVQEFSGVPETSGQDHMAWDPFDEKLWSFNNARTWYLDLDTGDVTELVNPVYPNPMYPVDIYTRGAVVRNKTAFGMRDTGPSALRAFAAVDFTSTESFAAFDAARELEYAALKRSDKQSTAALTVTKGAQGVAVSGELAKAALEYYTGKIAPADYADHLYKIEFSRSANGLGSEGRDTGNRSFKLENVNDDFSILTPCRVTLTVDGDLQLGSNLL